MKGKEKKERKIYVADSESRVDEDIENQDSTEVWSFAVCPVLQRPEPEHVTVWNNIFDFITWLSTLEDESIVFFHNLRWDSSFILIELEHEGFQQALKTDTDLMTAWEQKCTEYTYKAVVNDMGQWYSVRIRFEDRTIELRDSAKKIPCTLREMGKGFGCKYQKLEMDYVGERHQFGDITEDEMAYIKNDVLVLAEAMYKIWFEYNMRGLTIGADCIAEFKALNVDFEAKFPDVSTIMLNTVDGQTMSVYDYTRKAYSGGWCYKNPQADNKVFVSTMKSTAEMQVKLDELMNNCENIHYVKNSVVIDVNSLYPSVMVSAGNDGYPIGIPEYHTGAPTRREVAERCVFRRFRCKFSIKKGHLPFLHIRGSKYYSPNECLTTSDVMNPNVDTLREYTMTQVEYELFRQHYNVTEYEDIDCVVFLKSNDIFDSYIEKYKQMKIDATKTGNKALRQIAKLFLNNLYGKMASSDNSSYKILAIEDDIIKYVTIEEHNKKTVYMPAGAYVTAYARRFTIKAAQQNYYENMNKGFMYADTDSLHLVNYDIADIKGVKIDGSEFLCWAAEESKVAIATYAKQKTYIEIATEEDFKTLEEPSIIVKAAGLCGKGKDVFINAVKQGNMAISDFRSGLIIKKANLKLKNVRGGSLLIPSDFKMT